MVHGKPSANRERFLCGQPNCFIEELEGDERVLVLGSLRRVCPGPVKVGFEVDGNDTEGHFSGRAEYIACAEIERVNGFSGDGSNKGLSYKDVLGIR